MKTNYKQNILEQISTNEYIFYTKICIIGSRRPDVVWIQGNTWSIEGENWEEGVETMTTELDKLKEFAICSIDDLRDEAEIRMAETTTSFF